MLIETAAAATVAGLGLAYAAGRRAHAKAAIARAYFEHAGRGYYVVPDAPADEDRDPPPGPGPARLFERATTSRVLTEGGGSIALFAVFAFALWIG